MNPKKIIEFILISLLAIGSALIFTLGVFYKFLELIFLMLFSKSTDQKS